MHIRDARITISDWIRKNKVIRVISSVPKILYDKKLLRDYQRSPESEKIRSFKGKHEGESCFIIGNGPSLKKEDLANLEGRHTFCMNFGYKVYAEMDFSPEFYVATDPIFVGNFLDEILNDARPENYFLPYKSKEKADFPDNTNFITVYGPFTIVKGSLMNDDFSEDASRYLSLAYTVTFYALQLAVYMGFKKIYLVGIDHRYPLYTDSKGITRRNEKSSGKSYAEGIDIGKREGTNQIDSTTHSYKVARDYTKKRGIEILNATRGGDLEVFKRISFEEALKDDASFRKK